MPRSASAATNAIAARCRYLKTGLRTQGQCSGAPIQTRINPPTIKAAIAKCATRSASASLIATNGPFRVADPVAPGAGVQACARHPGHFHREEVVTRGDARAAVVDDFVRAARAEDLAELLAQDFRRLERALRREVVVAEAVLRARDVSRHLVDRLLLAAEAHRRTRVEEHELVARLLDRA